MESATPNHCRPIGARDSCVLGTSYTPPAYREGSVSSGRRPQQSNREWGAAPRAVSGFPDCPERWFTRGDPEVLALAAEHRRVLVSHDVGTMALHFRHSEMPDNGAPV